MTNKKERSRANHLWKKYGITIKEYEDLLIFQNNACAFCKKPASSFKKRLSVDHDHRTGAIRALVCFYCNKFKIGRFTVQDAETLVGYLSYPTADLCFGVTKFVPPKIKKRRKR